MNEKNEWEIKVKKEEILNNLEHEYGLKVDKYEKEINFDCAGYSQSDKVVSKSGSSVSYAAAVNFIM